MQFSEYQALAARTMKPRRTLQEDLSDYVMGLAGEVGELTNAVKKMFYHGHDWDNNKIIEETGDILWYAAVILQRLGISLNTVAQRNIEKLKKRYPDGYSDERSRARLDNDS